MHRPYVIIYILCITLVCCYGIPCDSCGNECASACGTKHFRSCCFNYLRKRSEVKTIKLVSNKKLTDYIMLQGKTMFTRNEMSSRHANILLTSTNNSTHNARKPNKQIYNYNKRCLENISNCINY
ncbi:trissin [Episyrphus balteatus]|uniref:trissin n=1 Tax=Episyrphus balteatus TaxID=286459 RepID=UPI002484FAF2|nr:trissin [Episyrphus balteatus]